MLPDHWRSADLGKHGLDIIWSFVFFSGNRYTWRRIAFAQLTFCVPLSARSSQVTIVATSNKLLVAPLPVARCSPNLHDEGGTLFICVKTILHFRPSPLFWPRRRRVRKETDVGLCRVGRRTGKRHPSYEDVIETPWASQPVLGRPSQPPPPPSPGAREKETFAIGAHRWCH